MGSSRFKFPSDFFSELGFFTVPSSEFTTRLGFLPILEASNTSNPAAGRKIRSVQYFKSNRSTRRANSFLNRWLGFLRFRRTRTRIRPRSSESSSDTEIDMLLLPNIEDDIDGGYGRNCNGSKQMRIAATRWLFTRQKEKP